MPSAMAPAVGLTRDRVARRAAGAGSTWRERLIDLDHAHLVELEPRPGQRLPVAGTGPIHDRGSTPPRHAHEPSLRHEELLDRLDATSSAHAPSEAARVPAVTDLSVGSERRLSFDRPSGVVWGGWIRLAEDPAPPLPAGGANPATLLANRPRARAGASGDAGEPVLVLAKTPSSRRRLGGLAHRVDAVPLLQLRIDDRQPSAVEELCSADGWAALESA